MLLPSKTCVAAIGAVRRRTASRAGVLALAVTFVAATVPVVAQPVAPAAQPAAESPVPSAAPAGTTAPGSEPAPAIPAPAATPAAAAAPPDAALSPRPETPTAGILLPHDLSPWAMFMNADLVVKTVMVGLAFASLVTWTVWVAKSLQLYGARFRAVRGVRALLKADGLGEIGQVGAAGPLGGGPVAALVHAATSERERSARLPPDGVKERTAIALARIEARAARTMTRGTGVVATIGSTAPFVGLFGTVWGIMNSFVGISQAHTTNLAVVAPGIAEALLATAIGLVAAIPAVVIYNHFARGIAGYKALMSDASAEVMRHLSRELDRHPEPAE